MILSKEERDIVLHALYFLENESMHTDASMALIERLQKEEMSKIYRIRYLDGAGGDRIAIAESREEAEQIFTDNYLNPFLMEEVCEVKNGTFIG